MKKNMKIKWKAGISLLFLLTTFLIYGFLVEHNSWGMKLSENVILHMLLWFLALTEVVIFLIGLRYTVKNIKNKNFSYLRAILFNALFWLLVTILFEILGLFVYPTILRLIGVSFSGEGAGFFIILWMLYTPLVAFFSIILFSFIPSIVYYIIFNKPSYQKLILYSTLVLGALILLFAFTMLFTCNLGSSIKCISKKAINDIEICEKENTDFNKCRCYTALVENAGYASGIEPCNRYKKLNAFCSDQVNRCISFVAKNSMNLAFCEFIEPRKNDWSKEICIEYSKK